MNGCAVAMFRVLRNEASRGSAVGEQPTLIANRQGREDSGDTGHAANQYSEPNRQRIPLRTLRNIQLRIRG